MSWDRIKAINEGRLLTYSTLGELDEIKKLVKQNVNVNCTNEKGETALHQACYQGHLDIVEYLAENNADLEYEDDYKYIPLHAAISRGHLKIVKYLLEKGVKFKTESHHGWSLVHWAVNGGHLDILKYLADQNYDLECRDSTGHTPFHLACLNGKSNIEVIKYLIEKNVDYDTVNDNGGSPLYTACWMNAAAAIVLIKHNANIHFSCNGFTSLHNAAKKGYIDVAEYLLRKNADLQSIDDYLETPFHKALKSCNPELVKLFVDVVHDDFHTRLDRGVKVRPIYEIAKYYNTLLFKAPRWNLSFKTEMEKVIERHCDESFICRLKEGPLGVHFLKRPIKLECGHSFCIDCALDKISSNDYAILFCCLNYVKNVQYCTQYSYIADKDLLDYSFYDPLELDITIRLSSLTQSYLTTLNNAIEIIRKRNERKELVFKFIEEEIEIRMHSINGELNLLKRRLDRLIERIRFSCKKFINSKEMTSDSRIYLHSLYKFRVTSQRLFKNNIGFVVRKGETHEGYIGFDKSQDYYKNMNKIYGKNKQSGHERDSTIFGLWRHVTETAHSSDRYVILDLESLVKSVQSPQDLEKLAFIYDYTLSFIKTRTKKTKLSNKQQIPEMKMRIGIYLEATKKKLVTLCNNEALINDAIERLARLCNAIADLMHH